MRCWAGARRIFVWGFAFLHALVFTFGFINVSTFQCIL